VPVAWYVVYNDLARSLGPISERSKTPAMLVIGHFI
jgi:hypothetical protein